MPTGNAQAKQANPITLVTVGSKISIYGPTIRSYFTATVTKINGDSAQIVYSDGSREDITLAKEDWMLLPEKRGAVKEDQRSVIHSGPISYGRVRFQSSAATVPPKKRNSPIVLSLIKKSLARERLYRAAASLMKVGGNSATHVGIVASHASRSGEKVTGVSVNPTRAVTDVKPCSHALEIPRGGIDFLVATHGSASDFLNIGATPPLTMGLPRVTMSSGRSGNHPALPQEAICCHTKRDSCKGGKKTTLQLCEGCVTEKFASMNIDRP